MKKRRILSLILALTMCASSAFAFGCRGGGGWDVDETKVQVYVGPYNGGWGSDFVEVWKTAYEEMHKDEVYQTPEGEKVGVEIKYSVDGSYGGQLATTTSSVHDIILAEVVDYRDLVSNGDLVDVSSWVSEVNPYDGKTIKSKMTDDQISFFTDDSKIKMEAQRQEEINKNGSSSINPYDQFYAVPSYQATYNMYYDRQLFEDKGLFFQEIDGVASVIGASDYKSAKANGLLTKGPDNKTGVINGIDYSEDDGLPRTTAEFIELFNIMPGRGVTPFSCAGGLPFYFAQFMMSLWTSFSGYENMMNNFDYTGKELLVKDIKADGTIVYDDQPTTITCANGYELQRQAGKYMALDWAEKVLKASNGYISDSVYLRPASYLNAQNNFVKSIEEAEKPFAIHVDGSWWYNEVKGTMNAMAQTVNPKYSPFNRRIGILPNPLAEIGQQQTAFACNYPSIFVNKHHVEDWREPVVKDFFQFMFSDPGLSMYSISVNATMSYNYNLISYEESSNYPNVVFPEYYFAEDGAYILKDAIQVQRTYKLVTPQFTNSMYASNGCPTNGDHALAWRTVVNRKEINVPFGCFTKGEVTAKDYFLGLKDGKTVKEWNTNFKDAFFN